MAKSRETKQPDEIQDLKLIRQNLEEIRRQVLKPEIVAKRHKIESLAKCLKAVHPEYVRSAENFLHYLALRRHDLKPLQLKLAQYGLSSLGRSESFVLESLDQTLARVDQSLQALGVSTIKPRAAKARGAGNPVTWPEGEELLHRHTRSIFGPRPQRRHVYVMVTVPEADLVTVEWIRELLLSGVNVFRVNCAHDAEADWECVINCIRNTARDLRLPCRILMDLAGPKIRVASPKKIAANVGDRITIAKENFKGKDKKVLHCSLPEVLRHVRVGDRVLFDDGKFESVVRGVKTRSVEIEITRVPHQDAKIKIEKGMNFPDTQLTIDELTPADLKNFQFVARHADMVGLSFIHQPSAIRRIRAQCRKLGREDLGIVLKIETQAGFRALPRLLLESMCGYPVAVMIARGDLAVEAGFERIVEMQEEILWLCEAAHIPVIWATQVLETMSKIGLPSRAEVTDAAAATRAECVMLNKGPHIPEAVRLLDDILMRMEKHTYKKRQLFRPLHVALGG